MGHQHNFSSGALSNATVNLPAYNQNHLQNGLADSVPDEMEEHISEHWQEQLQLAAESRLASSPHHYARSVAQQSKGLSFVSASSAVDDIREEERQRATDDSEKDGRQHWQALDFGGQGLRALSDALFRYGFLRKLHLTHNKLDHLPAAIGKMKNLVHLDVSANLLTELPEELGMLTNLQKLLLFDNSVQNLPYELGFLYNLETLGIQGNPLDEDLKTKIMQEGTKKLIIYLRENMPGKFACSGNCSIHVEGR